MATRRIIIDTDPGIDDAVAILLALASPELEVAGIVAVAGNMPLPVTEANARAICELAGRLDIAVYAGCSRPITRPPITAEYFHGPGGLGTLLLPVPAMALIMAPDIVAGVSELVLMGGASRALGNTTPAAEFNIHADPHAAQVVFESGLPITMIPLDAPLQARS